VSAYAGSLQHLLAELERIDLLIRVQVGRARQSHRDEEQGRGPFAIADEEVDEHLDAAIGTPTWDAVPVPVEVARSIEARLDRLADEIARRTDESEAQGTTLRLPALADLFDLDAFDLDVVLACLAPELDRRYERLYAYLHDDVTRGRPTVGLVLDLLCPDLETRVAVRGRFTPAASLFRHDLVRLGDEAGHRSPSLLARTLELDPRIVRYLLGGDQLDGMDGIDGIDDRLADVAELVTPSIGLAALAFSARFLQQLTPLADEVRAGVDDLVVYCQGGDGVGKQSIAEALCRERGVRLLVVRCSALAARPGDEQRRLIRVAGREARMQGAALYWDDVDGLFADDRWDQLGAVLAVVDAQPGLTFLAGSLPWEPSDALHGIPFVRLELPQPGYRERLELWRSALAGDESLGPDVDLVALAGRFRLSGGQIDDAAATARNLAFARAPSGPEISQGDLFAACRLRSNRRLTELAQRITPRYGWDDIVLPAGQIEQLHEIHDQVRYRAVVHEDWGFGRKLALGKGLNVLFSGPPGTGKTMAADVLANVLGLDLYKIDLASVVSKYIGETEKNLARIFDEAATSNAILFFDEADALFGKRTPVRDAHDRYANVEVSYLLQRMEQYEGVVILATNLRKNMDEAFVRRLHVMIELPLPGEADRRRIWSRVWPAATPLVPDLDLDALARDVELAGGSLRNIAVASAFLAAANGGVVTMDHLHHATAREYQKMGKVLTGGPVGSVP
jgi:AAA+ superfamily predicted ATPase